MRYSLNLKSIRIPALDFRHDYNESFCDDDSSNCVTDSGNSQLQLPISEEMCKTFNEEELSSDLFIDIEGSGGNSVTLSFPLAFLADEGDWVGCVGTNGAFALGMPVFQYYYLVYDMGNHEVAFVDLREGSHANGTVETIDNSSVDSSEGKPVVDGTEVVSNYSVKCSDFAWSFVTATAIAVLYFEWC